MERGRQRTTRGLWKPGRLPAAITGKLAIFSIVSAIPRMDQNTDSEILKRIETKLDRLLERSPGGEFWQGWLKAIKDQLVEIKNLLKK
jgi:hypothetical protein